MPFAASNGARIYWKLDFARNALAYVFWPPSFPNLKSALPSTSSLCSPGVGGAFMAEIGRAPSTRIGQWIAGTAPRSR